MKTKIWCLFSIDCNYDQPDNNLVCWWQEKPSLETLFKALGFNISDTQDDVVVNIVKVWSSGEDVQLTLGGTSFRLEEVQEGINLGDAI
jgi:hypothetical protein